MHRERADIHICAHELLHTFPYQMEEGFNFVTGYLMMWKKWLEKQHTSLHFILKVFKNIIPIDMNRSDSCITHTISHLCLWNTDNDEKAEPRLRVKRPVPKWLSDLGSLTPLGFSFLSCLNRDNDLVTLEGFHEGKIKIH